MAIYVHLWGLVVLLAHIPGALCETYSIAGMAAASVATFLLLLIIIVMIVVSFIWNDWFPRWQRMRGRVKYPREQFRLFASKKELSRENILARDFTYQVPTESRHSRRTTPQSTLVRSHPPHPPDTWIQEENLDFFNRAGEDQSKSMNFGDEHRDEPVIIAEVLPEGTVETGDPVEPLQRIETTDVDYQYTHVIKVSEEQPIGGHNSLRTSHVVSDQQGEATLAFDDEDIETPTHHSDGPLVVLY